MRSLEISIVAVMEVEYPDWHVTKDEFQVITLYRNESFFNIMYNGLNTATGCNPFSSQLFHRNVCHEIWGYNSVLI